MVFMNHEAPPSIAIDIQSWVRFGSGQLANIAGTLDNANLAGDFKEARNGGLWSVISAVVVACITSAPAQVQSERAAHQAQWEGVNFGRRSPSSGGQNCTPNNI
jgi:hypothetical protein